MASLDDISPEIIQQISTLIDQRLKSLGTFSREQLQVGGAFDGQRRTAKKGQRQPTLAETQPARAEDVTGP